MRSNKLNISSGSYGAIPRSVKSISATVGEFGVNADTVSGDKTMTLDSETEIFIGSAVSGPGIPAGSKVASINTGTAGTNVTSVELDKAAVATATNINTIHLNGTHLLASESGSVILVPDLDDDHHFTLPEIEEGLNYEFWYTGTAADASDWEIKTRGADDGSIFIGGVVLHDTDNAGDDTAVIDANGSSNNHIQVLTPIAGTRISFICNGKDWYINGTLIGATDTGIVFADHA